MISLNKCGNHLWGGPTGPPYPPPADSKMKLFILKRFITIGITLVGLSLIVFAVSRVAPGDPAKVAAGPDATEEMVQVIRKEFNLDRSLPVQYFNYVRGLLRGDFGRSIRTRHRVWEDLKTFLPATLELVFVSISFAILLGVLFGVLSAVHRDTWVDHSTRFFSVAGVAVPMFWLGIMLQILLAAKFHLLPIGGRLATSVMPPPPITRLFLVDALLAGNWAVFKDALGHILLPAFVLSFPALASITRINRAEMLEVLRKDFVLNEKAQGLSNRLILWKYALKNAFIPTLTMIGLRRGSVSCLNFCT